MPLHDEMGKQEHLNNITYKTTALRAILSQIFYNKVDTLYLFDIFETSYCMSIYQRA